MKNAHDGGVGHSNRRSRPKTWYIGTVQFHPVGIRSGRIQIFGIAGRILTCKLRPHFRLFAVIGEELHVVVSTRIIELISPSTIQHEIVDRVLKEHAGERRIDQVVIQWIRADLANAAEVWQRHRLDGDLILIGNA